MAITTFSEPTARIKPSVLNANNVYLNDKINNVTGNVAENAYKILKAAGSYENGDDIMVDRYTSAAGVNATVDTTNSTALFSTNKYLSNDSFNGSNPIVTIEATSVNVSAFAINNCLCKQYATGKWVVYCTTGTVEVRKAQIMKTLFYGTTGANPVATTTNITGITALRTNISNFVGKIGHYASASCPAASNQTYTNNYTGTFADTTNNSNCAAWSYTNVTCTAGGGINTATAAFEMPNGTTVNTISGNSTSFNSTSDETGTDTSADNKNNPASVDLYGTTYSNISSATSATTKAVIICYGTISWVNSGNGSGSNTNFNVTYSIPAFTTLTDSLSSSVILNSSTLSLNGSETTVACYGNTQNSLVYSNAGDGANDTESHGQTLASAGDQTTKYGVQILGKNNATLKTVTKNASSTATKCYLYVGQTYSTATLLEGPITYSGNTATFTKNIVLEGGHYYWIVNDNAGASYTAYADSTGITFPYSATNTIYTKGLSAGVESTTVLSEIESFVTQNTTGSLTPITSLKFNISDGTTTTSDVTANSQGKAIVDVSALSSGNMKVTAKLETTDTSISPELYGIGVNILR